MWAPVGPVARGAISIAVDHEGGLALVGTLGSGGSTPTVNVGIGVTATNAPSVAKLAGTSVQIGGSADLGIGVFAEGVLFRDSDTAELYTGLSVSAIGSFPDPLLGSVHGTVENSWVLGVNLIDALFYPIEWALSED